MRQIEAPGIEIKEIDRSGYAPAMTGTKVYAMGFANKGECYTPMQFTSRNAWLNYYGEPENEAERYFYNASMETINQGGVLYTARLPYDNDSFEKVAVAQYEIDDKSTQIVGGGVSSFIEWYIDEYLAQDDIKMLDITELTSIGTETPATPKFFKFDSDTNSQEVFKSIINTYEDDGYLNYTSNVDWLKTTVLNNVIDFDNLNPSWNDETYVDSINAKMFLSSTLFNFAQATLMLSESETSKKIEEDYAKFIKNKLQNSTLKELIDIPSTDSTIDTTIQIEFKGAEYKDTATIDEWRSNESKPRAMTINIVDKTYGQYKKVQEDDRKGNKRELIGIIPVMTTAANALLAQQMINIVDTDNISAYESVIGADTIDYKDEEFNSIIPPNELRVSDLTKQFCTVNAITEDEKDLSKLDSLSKDANIFFSPISLTETGTIDRENLKKVGIVVVKAYLDASQGNKISFEPVESFVGSLDKNAVNINTGASLFIDNIVNTTSEYIEVYTNYNLKVAANKKIYDEADLFYVPPHKTKVLGFYEEMCAKDISTSKSIMQGMQKCFDKVSDLNERDIDLVVDAGITNIAQFIKSINLGDKQPYDPTFSHWGEDSAGNPTVSAKNWLCNAEHTKIWKSVANIFLNFCSKTRKDCMFVLDGPRPFCLVGNKKIVRPTKPSNTIDANILPNVKFLTGINNNYGAGYCDWFEVADEFTGDMFWLPPSIKATGVMIYTDLNFNYWDAPAGLNRGVCHGAVDVAFSPTNAQAGAIYPKCWNYAVNYPNDGIVLEGQRTLQVKPSAFDRINVRRLFLRLERQAYKISRYFLYEGNTAYTRQKLVDTLRPDFDNAKVGGGIYDYKIICDESNNTPDVIDRNELKVAIGIKPVKSAEFILIDFIALSTGASWDEM